MAVKKVKVNGLNLAYEEVEPEQSQGSVLLLTGLGGNRTAWYGHLTFFGKHYHTVALDHRDSGDSDRAEDFYTTADQASDAARVIMELGLSPAHVVGVSMGGYISMELAVNYPSLVRSLTLVSTSAGGPYHVAATPEAEEALERKPDESAAEHLRRSYPLIVAPGYFDKYPERLRRLSEGAARVEMEFDAYNRQRQTHQSRTTYERIQFITAPTLVIHGADDPLTPVENARRLASLIPGARLIIYPDCGHLVTMEKSREFSRDVLQFLQQH